MPITLQLPDNLTRIRFTRGCRIKNCKGR